MEFEATVPGIMAKVQSALNSEDLLILTDAQGNQIVESEGTKGILLPSLFYAEYFIAINTVLWFHLISWHLNVYS